MWPMILLMSRLPRRTLLRDVYRFNRTYVIPLSHSSCLCYAVCLEWYNNLSLTPRMQSCVNKLGITLSIIGHNSRDSGISVLNTV